MDMLPPQVLGFSDPNDFKAYFFKHFVWTKVFACRNTDQIRVIFSDRNWTHVFWRDGEAFDLARAERMPWILVALKSPEEIYEAHEGDREVYILTKGRWGEDFCIVIERTRSEEVWRFVTAYSPNPWNMLKIRFCNQKVSL